MKTLQLLSILFVLVMLSSCGTKVTQYKVEVIYMNDSTEVFSESFKHSVCGCSPVPTLEFFPAAKDGVGCLRYTNSNTPFACGVKKYKVLSKKTSKLIKE